MEKYSETSLSVSLRIISKLLGFFMMKNIKWYLRIPSLCSSGQTALWNTKFQTQISNNLDSLLKIPTVVEELSAFLFFSLLYCF